MSEMVERVARASFACWRKRMDELGHHMDRGRTFEDMNDSEMEFAYLNARAMIEAMREPTDAMVDAIVFHVDKYSVEPLTAGGWIIVDLHRSAQVGEKFDDPDLAQDTAERLGAKDALAAMIDEALR